MLPALHNHSCPLAPSILRAGHVRPCRASSRQQHRADRQCCHARLQEQEQDPAQQSGQQQQAGSQAAREAEATSLAAAEQQNNRALAGGAVLAGVALFAAVRASSGPATLSTLQRVSIPYETALTNGKPTLLEFYADWCEICRATAPDVYQVEQQQAEKLNFVMLNVDNNAWTPEKVEYRVSGIPHFVFLDDKGQARGAAIGKLPKQFLADNVARLISGTKLQFGRPASPPPASPVSREQAAARALAGPRSHA